nr:PREDICTED: probable LRR receptor-like serine/threonine-protein kinase At3g47570 isoform X2 [Daucus carota subsp. sativus]
MLWKEAYQIPWDYLIGSIPSDFGFALPNLQKIQLSNNKFTGNIPISLSNASRLQVIDLQFNNFSGPVSIDFGRLLHLQNLVLESNNLGLGGQSDLSFLNSLINCSSLKILKLGGNNFRGSLPHSVANLSNELTMISLADNRISGSIPLEIGKFINLIFLSLEGNRFTGIIPPEIAKLRKLQRVLLSNNRLSGNIPASIGNLSMLDEVHLENNELNGTIPPSFGHCPMLVLLELSQNNLSGSIPSKLFDISPFSLKLNLSQNHLVGSLPAGVGALKTLVELDISENQLSGLIPTQLADCIALNSLNMQGNFIQGNISQSMKKLRGLQYLDLSRNKLSGKIPDFLETLSLKYLNLSRNNLEGEVLKKGVFANASAFSIVGNKGLCGGIPELQLPRCSSHGSHKHKMSWVQVLIVISSIPVLAIGYYIWLRRRKEKPPSFLGSKTYTSPIKLSYKLLHEATEEFSPNNLVSEGNSGLVYKGKISSPPDNETFIAVKVFKPQASNQFITECEALRNIRHRNIIKIKSTCTGFTDINKKFTAIVYDFMEHKSLDRWKHLTSTSSHNEHCMPQILNLGTRINIAIDVANALDYIHNQVDNPLIHCNLKLSNILLDTDMSAHVSNFGMAKFLTDLGSTSQSNFDGFAGTLEYAPPEYYQGSMVSTKGDVYSYGIILLEMLTGKKITDPMFHGSFTLQNFVSNALSERVYDIIDLFILHELNRYDPARAKDCLKMLLDIGVRCAQEFPQFRPDIRDVLSVLETINNIFKASRVDTEAYPQGSFQAAFFMAQRFKRSLLRNRIEVPFQSPGVENFNRADWTIDRAGQSINPFPEIISDSVTVSYMDLHKATNGFSSTNLVGAGGFGSVYKGMFRQKKFHHLIRHGNIEAGTEAAVAIKVFNLQRRGAVRSFNTEYQTLKKLNHEYIVKIITTCTSVDHEGRDFRAILFEFMDHGSLQTWLHPTDNINDDGPNPPRTLSLLARINIAIDVACALDYLHRQCTNCIIHCDLKPGNILIDKDMFARIADFGLAISLPESANMTQCSSATGMRGTTGYIAPEYGLGCKMTTKGDTYSFGILLLEMLTSKKPTHRMFRGGLNLHNFVWMSLPDKVIDITDPLIMEMTSRTDGKQVEKRLTRMFDIGLACSKPSPKARPDMHAVLRELESIRNSF